MLAYRLYRLQQIPRSIRFHHITPSSGIQSLTHHLRRVVLGDEQNL
jgi:hypothetical protein